MSDEIEALREENEQLKKLCLELDQALTNSNLSSNHQKSAEKVLPESELEQLVEEKTQIIRKLHTENLEYQKVITELEDRLYGPGTNEITSNKPTQSNSNNETFENLSELETKRDNLIREIALMEKQLCEEEIRASRERADFARQRYDLERLKAELEIELEKHSKDTSLKTKIDTAKSRLINAGSEFEKLNRNPTKEPIQTAEVTAKKGYFERFFGSK